MQSIATFANDNWPYFAITGAILIAIGLLELISSHSKVKALSPADLALLTHRKSTRVFDLRTDEEYQAGHIPGSKLTSIEGLNKACRFNEKSKDKPIVIIAQRNALAHKAANTLIGSGFTEVCTLTGGLAAWRKQSLPLVAPSNKD